MLIQGEFEAAVQVQPAPAVTATDAAPPAATAVAAAGFSEYVQLPAWVTVRVWMPMTITPVRAGPELAATW